MKKTLKIAGVVLIGIFLASIILKIMDKNRQPIPLVGKQVMPLPQSADVSGMAGRFSANSSDIQSAPSVKSAPMSAAGDSLNAISSNESVVSSDVADKKVMKNGDIEMKVDSTEKSLDKITQIAKDNGGDVFSSNFYESGNNSKSGNVIVKIPVNNFQKTFSDLKGVGTLVIRESTSGTDVTMEYTDLQAKLRNAQAEEQSYQRLLDQAQKMDDILSITQQLSRVRGEIESLQGRIKFMDSQTDMASISIFLTEDANVTIADSWRPWQVVKDSVNALIKDVQEWINFIIRFIIEVIPVLVLYGIILFVVYKIGRMIYLKFGKKDVQE